jgi:DNA-binding NtrC family response regulator
MTNENSPAIVVIDDDEHHLDFVVTLLKRAHYRCVGFTSGRQALAHIGENAAELVITDIFMPEMDGFELLRAIRQDHPEIAVVTLSGEGRMTQNFYLKCAQNLGAIAALRKPFEPENLYAIVNQFMSRDRDRSAPKVAKLRPRIGRGRPHRNHDRGGVT